MTNPIIYEGTIFSELIIAFIEFSFTRNSHIFSDSVGENALNVLHTLQQQTGILQPPFLPSTGECIELVLKFVNYIYEFHGLVMLANSSVEMV